MDQYIFICACVLSGLVGLCVGSFLNVVIYRLPRGMSLARPSSHCTRCDYVLRWYDNIPVVAVKYVSDVPEDGHSEHSYDAFADAHSDFTPLLLRLEDLR